MSTVTFQQAPMPVELSEALQAGIRSRSYEIGFNLVYLSEDAPMNELHCDGLIRTLTALVSALGLTADIGRRTFSCGGDGSYWKLYVRNIKND